MNNNSNYRFYQNLDKYLTRKNIIIAVIIIALVVLGIIFWNQYQLATITIAPNIKGTNIIIEKSTLLNTGVTTTRETFLTKNNIDTLKIKLQPNFYYYIKAEKENYTSKYITIHPKFHETIQLTPYLNKPLLTTSVSFPTLNPDQSGIIYINTTNNKLSSYNFSTEQTQELFSEPITNVKNIIYSPDKTKLLLQLNNDNLTFSGGYAKANIDDQNTISTPHASPFYKPEFADNTTTNWLLNLKNQELIFLSQDIHNVAWINDNKIVYDYLYVEGSIENGDLSYINNLNLAEPTGANWQNILDLQAKYILFPKITPSPSGTKTILIPTPVESGYELLTSLNVFDLNSQNITTIADKQAYAASWSPDETKILYTKVDSSQNNKPTLWVSNTDGSSNRSLEIYTTTQKTAWLNNQEIIAAIPISPEEPDKLSSENIPENYTSLKFPSTSDALYLINLETGEKTNLFADNFQYLNNVQNIFSDSQNVYFTDKESKLYSLPLKK